MDPYYGTLIPSNSVPWSLTHFARDNIDMLMIQFWTVKTFPMLRAESETINKPKPSRRFHRR